MKHVALLLVSLLSLATAAKAASHTEVTPAPHLPFLRGMGFDGYYEGRNRPFMTNPDIYIGLAEKGFDHIRLPVDFRDYSTYDDSTGVATHPRQTDGAGEPDVVFSP